MVPKLINSGRNYSAFSMYISLVKIPFCFQQKTFQIKNYRILCTIVMYVQNSVSSMKILQQGNSSSRYFRSQRDQRNSESRSGMAMPQKKVNKILLERRERGERDVVYRIDRISIWMDPSYKTNISLRRATSPAIDVPDTR